MGYSSPTQSAIREDLNLSLSEVLIFILIFLKKNIEIFNQIFMQFSMFGSIITIGAMIGAVTSGRLADYIGRKGVLKI